MIHYAPDGEKHIADVKTRHGLVIEFQHSFLTKQERALREAFYRNMVCVVDGTRRKRDSKRFFDSIALWWRIGKRVFLASSVEEGLPKEWLDSCVPVYFDFGDVPIASPVLWCLLPKRVYGSAVVVAVQRAAVIDAYRNGRQVFDADKLIRDIEEGLRRRAYAAHAAHVLQQRSRPKLYYRKRYRPHNWRL